MRVLLSPQSALLAEINSFLSSLCVRGIVYVPVLKIRLPIILRVLHSLENFPCVWEFVPPLLLLI